MFAESEANSVFNRAKPLTVPVISLIEVDPALNQWLPESLSGIPTLGGMRVRPTLLLMKIDLPKAEIHAFTASYERRIGIGARDIWEKFPEYRGEYVVDIERHQPAATVRMEPPLKYTLADDKRIGTRLRLFDMPIIDEIHRIPNSICEEVHIENAELGNYAFISEPESHSDISILNKFIYFCDNISIVGAGSKELAPGLRFLTPSALLRGTDLIPTLDRKNASPPPLPPEIAAQFSLFPKARIPGRTSGIFLLEMEQQQSYADAIVNRTLAAAALSGAVFGKIPVVMRFTETGWHNSIRDQYAQRPYTEHFPESYTVSVNAPTFSFVLGLLKSTNVQKFISAKEDFRLLALDTIEDSRRSGVAVLQFAQIWMAIERLLPFRTETTAQLALALSAFSPLPQRSEQFKALKKSYGLRSQIVHGYNFSKDDPVFRRMEEMASLFRRLFLVSLSVKNSDELRDKLINHVLSGALDPIG